MRVVVLKEAIDTAAFTMSNIGILLSLYYMAPTFSHRFRNEMDEGLFVGLIGKGILLITTASATKFHSLRCYFQVMLWMRMADGMEVTE